MPKIDSANTSKKLLKNSGIIGIGVFCTKLLSFFLLPFFTAVFTTEEYGALDLIITYSNFLIVLVGLQISVAIFKFIASDRDNEEQIKTIVSTSWGVTLICVAVYLLLFFCVQRYLTITGKWFLLSQVITSLLLQTSTSISRGKGKNAIYAFSYFLSAAISISLNIVFVLVLKMGVFGGLLGYSIGPLVAFFFSFLANKEWKYISSSSYSKPKAKELLLFALPLIPNELSWTIIHASDRLIVSKILSVSSNGIISAASKFSSIYTSIFSVFNLAWTEQVIVNYKKDGGKEYINEMFDKMITFFGCLSTLIIALVPFVFNLLINSSFSEAYTIIPLYLVAVFFNAIVGLISAVYIAEGDTKRIAISTIVAALVNISVHLGLVFVIGIYAAPISSIAGYLTITIWRFVDVNKRYCKMRLKIRNVFVLLAALSISAMPYFFGALWVKVLCLALVSIITIILNWKIVIWFFKVFIKKTEKNNTEVKE
jgi:O-antigen/teichoic acid export membrane protein